MAGIPEEVEGAEGLALLRHAFLGFAATNEMFTTSFAAFLSRNFLSPDLSLLSAGHLLVHPSPIIYNAIFSISMIILPLEIGAKIS